MIPSEPTLISILLQPRLWFAAGLHVLLSIAVTLGMEYVRERLVSPVLLWQWEHVASPLLRIFLLMLFIALAYPIMFGLHEAPSLAALLASEHANTRNLVNLLFLIAVLFPLLPVIGNWQALILPLQGIFASAVVFTWLAREQGVIAISYWPGIPIFILIVVMAWLTHYLALAFAHHAGHRLDSALHLRDSSEFLARSTILVLQSPAILVYSLSLGRQLL